MHNATSPSSEDRSIDARLTAMGKNAPRITTDVIEAKIVKQDFHVPAGTTLTICILTLVNGFTATGESACVHPANFDEAIGRELARKKAIDKVWMLEGYALAERMMAGDNFGISREQEPKYGTSPVMGHLINRETGMPIPDDEPVFIFRAKDRKAVQALQFYASVVEDETHAAVVRRRIQDFQKFAADHSERMCEPSSSPAELATATAERSA